MLVERHSARIKATCLDAIDELTCAKLGCFYSQIQLRYIRAFLASIGGADAVALISGHYACDAERLRQ